MSGYSDQKNILQNNKTKLINGFSCNFDSLYLSQMYSSDEGESKSVHSNSNNNNNASSSNILSGKEDACENIFQSRQSDEDILNADRIHTLLSENSVFSEDMNHSKAMHNEGRKCFDSNILSNIVEEEKEDLLDFEDNSSCSSDNMVQTPKFYKSNVEQKMSKRYESDSDSSKTNEHQETCAKKRSRRPSTTLLKLKTFKNKKSTSSSSSTLNHESDKISNKLSLPSASSRRTRKVMPNYGVNKKIDRRSKEHKLEQQIWQRNFALVLDYFVKNGNIDIANDYVEEFEGENILLREWLDIQKVLMEIPGGLELDNRVALEELFVTEKQKTTASPNDAAQNSNQQSNRPISPSVQAALYKFKNIIGPRVSKEEFPISSLGYDYLPLKAEAKPAWEVRTKSVQRKNDSDAKKDQNNAGFSDPCSVEVAPSKFKGISSVETFQDAAMISDNKPSRSKLISHKSSKGLDQYEDEDESQDDNNLPSRSNDVHSDRTFMDNRGAPSFSITEGNVQYVAFVMRQSIKPNEKHFLGIGYVTKITDSSVSLTYLLSENPSYFVTSRFIDSKGSTTISKDRILARNLEISPQGFLDTKSKSVVSDLLKVYQAQG